MNQGPAPKPYGKAAEGELDGARGVVGVTIVGIGVSGVACVAKPKLAL